MKLKNIKEVITGYVALDKTLDDYLISFEPLFFSSNAKPNDKTRPILKTKSDSGFPVYRTIPELYDEVAIEYVDFFVMVEAYKSHLHIDEDSEGEPFENSEVLYNRANVLIIYTYDEFIKAFD